MLNTQFVETLATQGRARVIHLDSARRVCMVRLDPPPGGSLIWPANVVALRSVPYDVAKQFPLTHKQRR